MFFLPLKASKQAPLIFRLASKLTDVTSNSHPEASSAACRGLEKSGAMKEFPEWPLTQYTPRTLIVREGFCQLLSGIELLFL